MKLIMFLCVNILFMHSAFAGKSLGKHVHGSIGLDMAVEGKELLVMLKGPADSFLGFEYQAKTKKEKQTYNRVKKDFTDNLVKMLGEKSLKGCSVFKSKFEQEIMGENHSEIALEAYIKCEKTLSARHLSVSIIKNYPAIKSLHVQLIREDGSVLNQKFDSNSFEITL